MATVCFVFLFFFTLPIIFGVVTVFLMLILPLLVVRFTVASPVPIFETTIFARGVTFSVRILSGISE